MIYRVLRSFKCGVSKRITPVFKFCVKPDNRNAIWVKYKVKHLTQINLCIFCFTQNHKTFFPSAILIKSGKA